MSHDETTVSILSQSFYHERIVLSLAFMPTSFLPVVGISAPICNIEFFIQAFEVACDHTRCIRTNSEQIRYDP